MGEAPDDLYADKLRAAMHAADQMSVRQLSFRLSEETGISQEDERRALRKYLSGTVPEPERAALLAVVLRTPALALVPSRSERRSGRLAELGDVLEELVDNQRQMLANQEETLRLLRPAQRRRSA